MEDRSPSRETKKGKYLKGKERRSNTEQNLECGSLWFSLTSSFSLSVPPLSTHTTTTNPLDLHPSFLFFFLFATSSAMRSSQSRGQKREA